MPAKITANLKDFTHFGDRVEKEVISALTECAALVSNDAKAGHPKVRPISTAGTYRHRGRSSVIMAHDDTMRESNPDGSLRWLTRTGVTRNSILPRRPIKTLGGVLEVHIISGVQHSTKLEYGSATTRAFPFMRPALEKNRVEIFRRLTAAVRRGIG